MPLNTAAQNDALKSGTGGGVVGIITHIAVHQLTTGPGSGDGTPGTGTNAATGASPEATGGSPAYARQAVTWGSPASGQVSNTGTLTFDVPAGTYAYLGLYNASSGNTGNYRGFIPLGGASPLKGVFSVDTNLANDTLLSVGHGLVDGDRVILDDVWAESLPTGLTKGAAYYVVGSSTNAFKVSTTLGGSAVDITAVGGGEGFWAKVIPETFAAQGQITVAVGALVLDATAI